MIGRELPNPYSAFEVMSQRERLAIWDLERRNRDRLALMRGEVAPSTLAQMSPMDRASIMSHDAPSTRTSRGRGRPKAFSEEIRCHLQSQITELRRQKPRITLQEIALELGVTRKTLYRTLKRMDAPLGL
jgi:DNA-binding NtrC family response regulator